MFGLWGRRAARNGSDTDGAPETYAEWSAWFERFERGGEDDVLLELASRGKVNWSSGMATSFATRAASTLHARMEAIRLMLQKHLGTGRDEGDLGRAVVNARRAFAQLSRYAALPCWPDPLPGQLADMISQTTRAIQQSLLESAATDRTGRLAKMLRDNPVDREVAPVAPMAEHGPASPPSGRRILL
ncbi:hypothetical protein [Komagataeibacter sp. FNDCF1]|uniref:hypothetical protein n=1 Tax=Komagataeibacter sp. FNDCF1 TaxID=2878681 RepID=UPI001E589103|nr:hypothetical protein [Komagataeibacter sp. FNDCF1]MCE2563160.1 hypothetical protein [Komagataeibacter sp. FNDCF1]